MNKMLSKRIQAKTEESAVKALNEDRSEGHSFNKTLRHEGNGTFSVTCDYRCPDNSRMYSTSFSSFEEAQSFYESCTYHSDLSSLDSLFSNKPTPQPYQDLAPMPGPTPGTLEAPIGPVEMPIMLTPQASKVLKNKLIAISDFLDKSGQSDFSDVIDSLLVRK